MENPSHVVTLRDIARATGLHYSTVSLALRDSPRLSPATREKIQGTAHTLGYRPDPMLTALNVYRRASSQPRYQATIGWINNWPRREQLFENPEFLEYFQGASERAERLGYLLEQFWLQEPGMSPERLNRILRARNIQSILLAPLPKPNAIKGIDYQHVSAVCFGYSMQPSVLNVVTNHQFHSMSLLLRHLFGMGYRRPGLCLPTEMDDKAESSYLSSWLLTHWKRPDLGCVPPLLLDDAREEVVAAPLRKWLREHQPDVVIGLAYIGRKTQELGWAVPEQIGFANLSVNLAEPHWSGIYQNNKMIGRGAVDLVVGMLQRGDRGIPEIPIRLSVESTWMPGTTLRPQPEADAVPPRIAVATRPPGKSTRAKKKLQTT